MAFVLTSLLNPPDNAWLWVTRLGETEILLPAWLWVIACLWAVPAQRPLAMRWLQIMALGAGLTALTKMAFIGYGVGVARWDFTGLSGHSLFSATIWPVLLALAQPQHRHQPWQRLWPGTLLAVLIAASRVQVGAHSASEALLGCTVGLLLSTQVWRQAAVMPLTWHLLPSRVLCSLAVWMAVLPLTAPESHTQDWITALTLKVTRHAQPHERMPLKPRTVAASPAESPPPRSHEDRRRACGAQTHALR